MDEYDCETVIGWLIGTYIPYYEAQTGAAKGGVHTDSGDSGPPPPPPKKQ